MQRSLPIFAGLVLAITAQRSPYAGKRPIGYPQLETTTTAADLLGNRFGEGDATTQPLPLEALGDRELVNRISKLPVDQQPFWYLNWKALEENRNNPQNYPQRPNPFLVSGNVGNRNDANINVNNRFETTTFVATPQVNTRTDVEEKEKLDFSNLQHNVEQAIIGNTSNGKETGVKGIKQGSIANLSRDKHRYYLIFA